MSGPKPTINCILKKTSNKNNNKDNSQNAVLALCSGRWQTFEETVN